MQIFFSFTSDTADQDDASTELVAKKCGIAAISGIKHTRERNARKSSRRSVIDKRYLFGLSARRRLHLLFESANGRQCKGRLSLVIEELLSPHEIIPIRRQIYKPKRVA